MNKRLPLLEYTTTQYPNAQLGGVTVIALQHVIEGVHYLLKELFERGLHPQHTFIMGKCYSSNEEIANRMRADGVYVAPQSFAFDSWMSFDEQFPGYVREFLAEIKRQLPPQSNSRDILIIDDGGFLIQEILADNELLPRVRGALELTSSGYHRLSHLSIPFPVVNVARSHAKLAVEAPLIGKSVASHIQNYFHSCNLQKPRSLIIGGGPIGINIRNSLQQLGHSVHITDLQPTRSQIDSYAERLIEFDVIIGATGSMPFPVTQLSENEKNSLHLISASSSDREFPSAYIRAHAPRTSNAHVHFKYNNTILVNAGFPINFTGEKCSLPLSEVQLTMALILAAALEALCAKFCPGFIDLSASIQEKIYWTFCCMRQETNVANLSMKYRWVPKLTQ